MSENYNVNDAILKSGTWYELLDALQRDVDLSCEQVASKLAIVGILEKVSPDLPLSNDKVIKQLRAYGMHSVWSWSTELGFSRAMAELTEELEAVKQNGVWLPIQYLAALFELVDAKVDLDQSQEFLMSLRDIPAEDQARVASEIREGTKNGMDNILQLVEKEQALITQDVLGAYKLRVNVALGNRRFVK